MAIARGTVYEYARATGNTRGVLVLTNDVWNRKMRTAGVVRVAEPAVDDSLLAPVLHVEPPLQAHPATPVSVLQESLGSPICVLDDAVVERIEDALALVFGLRHLLADPARRPPGPRGPVDYPAWSNLYYLRRQAVARSSAAVDTVQDKRWVVVSLDVANRHNRYVVAARTTSRTKYPRNGIPFPEIEGGNARACPGDLSSFPASAFDLRRTFVPVDLPLHEMVAVANGIVETFALDGALQRLRDAGAI